MLAHLLKYDTVHGTLEEKVEVNGNNLVIDGKEYHVTSERDPANLKWGEFGVDIVIEATGIFRDREGAQNTWMQVRNASSSLHQVRMST